MVQEAQMKLCATFGKMDQKLDMICLINVNTIKNQQNKLTEINVFLAILNLQNAWLKRRKSKKTTIKYESWLKPTNKVTKTPFWYLHWLSHAYLTLHSSKCIADLEQVFVQLVESMIKQAQHKVYRGGRGIA